MPRVLCVWFPKWPIQRLRNERPELKRSELVLFAAPAQRFGQHPIELGLVGRQWRLDAVSLGRISPAVAGQNLAEEDIVIAARKDFCQPAIHPGQGIRENRRPAGGGDPRHIVDLFRTAHGESPG